LEYGGVSLHPDTATRHPRVNNWSDVKTNPGGGSLFASGKCAKQQRHFGQKGNLFFFFRNEFLGVLKLLADWNPACNENQLFEL
jgi:hypothetical protein